MSRYYFPIKKRIDIAGPDGNVFSLMGVGNRYLRLLQVPEIEQKEFREAMRSSDYEHALNVFKEWFGEDTLYNSNED